MPPAKPAGAVASAARQTPPTQQVQAKKTGPKTSAARKAGSAFIGAESGGTAAAVGARASKAKATAGKAARNTANPRAYYRAGKEVQGAGRLTRSDPRQLLLVEFLVCLVVLGAGTLLPAPKGRPQEGVPHLMVKGSALMLIFFILALTASTGPKSARAASGLGGLVTVGYVLASPDARTVVSWMSGFYSRPGTPSAGVPTAATESPAVLTYTPAVPYPWVLPGDQAVAGPPAAGELTA